MNMNEGSIFVEDTKHFVLLQIHNNERVQTSISFIFRRVV